MESIFAELYASEPLVDRFADDPVHAVDVIIPVINANELWERNLQSFYREIPIRRLLIGDGGCSDTTIPTVRGSPVSKC